MQVQYEHGEHHAYLQGLQHGQLPIDLHLPLHHISVLQFDLFPHVVSMLLELNDLLQVDYKE
ncbi:hypothetical protein D3C77_805110 [compost metagenome]